MASHSRRYKGYRLPDAVLKVFQNISSLYDVFQVSFSFSETVRVH